MKQLTIKLADELHRELKLHCVDKGVEMSEFIRRFIERALKPKGAKKHEKK